MTAPRKPNKPPQPSKPEKIYRNSLAQPTTLKVSPPPAPKNSPSKSEAKDKK